jgi:hypothetical protein
VSDLFVPKQPEREPVLRIAAGRRRHGVRQCSLTRARVRPGCHAVGHSPGRQVGRVAPFPRSSTALSPSSIEASLSAVRVVSRGAGGARVATVPCGARGPRAGSPWTPGGPGTTICRPRGRAPYSAHDPADLARFRGLPTAVRPRSLASRRRYRRRRGCGPSGSPPHIRAMACQMRSHARSGHWPQPSSTRPPRANQPIAGAVSPRNIRPDPTSTAWRGADRRVGGPRGERGSTRAWIACHARSSTRPERASPGHRDRAAWRHPPSRTAPTRPSMSIWRRTRLPVPVRRWFSRLQCGGATSTRAGAVARSQPCEVGTCAGHRAGHRVGGSFEPAEI